MVVFKRFSCRLRNMPPASLGDVDSTIIDVYMLTATNKQHKSIGPNNAPSKPR